MDVCCEAFALLAVVVGFHAVVAGAGVGVEVDTDKNSIAIAVGDGGAGVKGDKDITAACHGDGHSAVLEKALNTFGDA